MAAPKKLLLVEDQAVIAIAEAALLRRAGYDVVTVLSGELAIAAARADEGLDLVLMDIDLGRGMSGPEAARLILEFRSLPIVFLTSHSEREMVEKVRNITRFGYVIKNSGEFVLLSSIEMAFELFETQSRVKEERNNIRQVLDTIDEAFYLKEVESGKMLLISPSYERMWGLPADSLERDTRSFMDSIHPDDLPAVEARRAEMLAGGRPFDMEYRIRRPDGQIRWLNAKTKRITDGSGRILRYAAIAQDITDKKLAEIGLENERRSLRALLSSIPSLVILTGPDSDAPAYVTPNSLQMTGYSAEELMSGFREFAHEDDRERVAEAMREALESKTDGNGFEFKARKKDGSVWFASASWRSLRDDSGAYEGRVFQIIDVTALRQAEAALRESEGKYRAIADHTVNWESWFSPSGEYLWVNPAVKEITGYSREEVLAMDDFIPVMIAEEDRATFTETFRVAISSREPRSNYEFRFRRKDGGLRWLCASWTPIFDDEGGALGIRASGYDITERKLAEERVGQLLAEKELLLREVHHRIKNNMSLVASMLSIQADMMDDSAAASVLTDMRGRISGMSILYDRLYRSESFQRLSTRDYLSAILEGIAAEYSGSSAAVLHWEIVDRDLDARLLFTLGLIVNELVTNAFKHGFPGGRRGRIELRLGEASPGAFELLVSDDGVGMPDTALASKPLGFGFLLVETLTQQIGGSWKRGSGEGSRLSIEFSIDAPD